MYVHPHPHPHLQYIQCTYTCSLLVTEGAISAGSAHASQALDISRLVPACLVLICAICEGTKNMECANQHGPPLKALIYEVSYYVPKSLYLDLEICVTQKMLYCPKSPSFGAYQAIPRAD